MSRYNGNFSSPLNEYLYHTYYGKKVPLGFSLIPITYFIFLMGSYIGNTLVVVATVKNGKLHGTYNCFVCIICIGDMLHQSTHWIYLIHSFFGERFIPYYRCFALDFVLASGATISALATLYVGIDRLIGVAFPVTYQRLNGMVYVGGLFGISLIYAGFVVYLGFEHAMGEFGNEPVLCRIIDSFGGKSRDAWFLMCMGVNLLDVIVYITVWILLKTKTKANDSMRRVFKSLAVMMFTVVFGWMLNAFVVAVVLPHVPIEQWFYYESGFGVLINVASSGNVVILYCLSGEYRLTIRGILGLPDKPSKTAPVSTVAPTTKLESEPKEAD